MKKYLRNCRRLFPIYGSYERQFMKKLKAQIENYLEDTTDASYDDIVAQFGSPTEVVISYYENVDEDALLKKANFVKQLRFFFIGLLVILIVFFTYRGVVIHRAFSELQDSVIIHEETTIMYED